MENEDGLDDDVADCECCDCRELDLFLDLVRTGVLVLSRHCASPMLAAKAAMRVHAEAEMVESLLDDESPVGAAERFLEVNWPIAVDEVCEEAKAKEAT